MDKLLGDNTETCSPSLKENYHTLNTGWIIWYHSPSDKSWSKESYKSILELNTVEEYILIEQSWNECLPSVVEGMYFLMRKYKNGIIVYPQWEDINNKLGGYWSFKVDNSQASEIWNKLCQLTLGEMICDENEDPLQINGISISPKKTFCIIKIWNNNCTKQKIEILSEHLNFFNMDEVKYSSHDKNIERDAEKLARYREKQKDKSRMTMNKLSFRY